jgi:hypothetical protein
LREETRLERVRVKVRVSRRVCHANPSVLRRVRTFVFNREGYDGDPITTPIELKDCNGDSDQEFVGFQSNGEFELRPQNRGDRCLGTIIIQSRQ